MDFGAVETRAGRPMGTAQVLLPEEITARSIRAAEILEEETRIPVDLLVVAIPVAVEVVHIPEAAAHRQEEDRVVDSLVVADRTRAVAAGCPAVVGAAEVAAHTAVVVVAVVGVEIAAATTKSQSALI